MLSQKQACCLQAAIIHFRICRAIQRLPAPGLLANRQLPDRPHRAPSAPIREDGARSPGLARPWLSCKRPDASLKRQKGDFLLRANKRGESSRTVRRTMKRRTARSELPILCRRLCNDADCRDWIEWQTVPLQVHEPDLAQRLSELIRECLRVARCCAG